MTKYDIHAHSKLCFSRAIIAAVENFRDDSSITSEDFFNVAHADAPHDFVSVATDYLADGTATCACHIEAARQVMKAVINEDVPWAQSLAESHLRNNSITVQDYLQLVRWTEGKSSYFDDLIGTRASHA